MIDPAEVKLIRQCQQGSEDAFRELVERYQKRTYWIAYNMVNNYEAAQDVSQEAFVRIFKAIKQFNLDKNFYTWLYQIVVNLSIDYLRKESHYRGVALDDLGVLPDPTKDPEDAADRKETKGRVTQILNKMSLKYKTVLILRDIQGFSCEEIAEIVGCTNPTVRWRLHRARKMFKSLWEGKTITVEDERETDFRE